MEALSFVKNFKIGDGWEQAVITEEEEKTLQEIIEKKNENLMKRCFDIAEKIVAKYTAPYSRNIEVLTQVACSFYSSNRIHAQNLFESFIARKIYHLRNGQSAKIDEYEEDWRSD